jgi:uncharacterized protein YkwD
MIKRILSICTGAGLLLVVLVVAWPAAAEQITSRIVQGITAVKTGNMTLVGSREPVIKIVDPSTVSTVLAKEAPQLIAIFKKDTSANGTLAIEDIIDATNRERIQDGKAPLKVNVKLTQSAKIKTDDMIAQQYFEHTSPNGDAVSDLGEKVGYDYIIMGENLALGNFIDANDLVQAWMDSPGHRANVLNPLYQEIGIYATKGVYEGREVWFAVQHFGVGRTACPSINKTLKKDIDIKNTELTKLLAQIEKLKGEIETMSPEDPDYDDNVEQFDAMVNSYNRELDISRYAIGLYNEQVRVFNACLSKYQK